MLTLLGCFQVNVHLKSSFSNEIKKNYIAVISTWTSDVKRQTHSSEQCLIPARTFLQTADGGAY